MSALTFQSSICIRKKTCYFLSFLPSHQFYSHTKPKIEISGDKEAPPHTHTHTHTHKSARVVNERLKDKTETVKND